MKYSFRKSFNSRRRKEVHEDKHIYPRIDTNYISNSNSNLVKTKKSKSFLKRYRRHSSQSSISSTDKIKSKVFEPRYDTDSYDNNEPFSSSSIKTHNTNPFNRLTYQIRKSFRNTLTRQRSRFESTNSNKNLIFNKTNENQTHNSISYPSLSTGLTSPWTKSIENEQIKVSTKRRKAPLAPTHINQSISLPTEINPEHQQIDHISLNNQQNLKKTNFNRSFRKSFSFLLKKRHEDNNHDNQNEKLTFSQRFDSLKRSFHIGNRKSSNKNQSYLLSNE